MATVREEQLVVGEDDVINFLGPGAPRVLATPRMIGMMERNCRLLVESMLQPGQATVGVHVNVWHNAAAVLGTSITVRGELTKAVSKRLEFKVEVRAGDKVIGEGTHQRAIIDVSRFQVRSETNPT